MSYLPPPGRDWPVDLDAEVVDRGDAVAAPAGRIPPPAAPASHHEDGRLPWRPGGESCSLRSSVAPLVAHPAAGSPPAGGGSPRIVRGPRPAVTPARHHTAVRSGPEPPGRATPRAAGPTPAGFRAGSPRRASCLLVGRTRARPPCRAPRGSSPAPAVHHASPAPARDTRADPPHRPPGRSGSITGTCR